MKNIVQWLDSIVSQALKGIGAENITGFQIHYGRGIGMSLLDGKLIDSKETGLVGGTLQFHFMFIEGLIHELFMNVADCTPVDS